MQEPRPGAHEGASQTMFTFNEGHSRVLLDTFGTLFRPYAMYTTETRATITIPITDLVAMSYRTPTILPVVLHKMGDELGQFQFSGHFSAFKAYKEDYDAQIVSNDRKEREKAAASLGLAREQITTALQLISVAEEKVRSIHEFIEGANGVIIEEARKDKAVNVKLPIGKTGRSRNKSMKDPQYTVYDSLDHIMQKQEELLRILGTTNNQPLRSIYEAALSELPASA